MNQSASQPSTEPARRPAGHAVERRSSSRLCWAGPLAAALLGTGVLAAGCGSGSSRQDVASLRSATTVPSAVSDAGGGLADPKLVALAFAACMRSHGEPNFPEPIFQGRSAREVITAGSGIDPDSPQFTAATNACKHLLPRTGARSGGPTITPADETDYLKAAACMRSHGITGFPDPTFRDSTVSFPSGTPIDTNTPQYQHALTTCQKLIPAGLPYSASSGP